MINNEIILVTNTTLLTVPAGKSYALLGIQFCNVSPTVEDKVTVYAIKSGDSAGQKNTILKNKSVGPEESPSLDFKLLLSEGDTVVAIGATGSLVSATLTFSEV
jgi:hypothetical protein